MRNFHGVIFIWTRTQHIGGFQICISVPLNYELEAGSAKNFEDFWKIVDFSYGTFCMFYGICLQKFQIG